MVQANFLGHWDVARKGGQILFHRHNSLIIIIRIIIIMEALLSFSMGIGMRALIWHLLGHGWDICGRSYIYISLFILMLVVFLCGQASGIPT